MAKQHYQNSTFNLFTVNRLNKLYFMSCEAIRAKKLCKQNYNIFHDNGGQSVSSDVLYELPAFLEPIVKMNNYDSQIILKKSY